MTKATLGRSSTNACLHPYSKRKFKGTPEVQRLQKASLEKPGPVATYVDFRKDKTPSENTCEFGKHKNQSI